MKNETLAIKWQQELDLFSAFKSLFVFDGNINDYQMNKDGDKIALLSMEEYLYQHFHTLGYHSVVFFDPINGFLSMTKNGKSDLMLFSKMMQTVDENKTDKSFSLPTDIREASSLLLKAMKNTGHPVVMIFNLASLFSSNKEKLPENLQFFFSSIFQASRLSQDGVEKRNLVVLTSNKMSDIPSWVYSQNPFCKTLSIPFPDKHIRSLYINSKFRLFKPLLNPVEDEEKVKEIFVSSTEGLSLIDIDNLAHLMLSRKISLSNTRDAVSLYKYGVKENPWTDKELFKRLPSLHDDLKKRVKGQDICLQQASDILTRSILGLSGIQHSDSEAKPKGILFLAGPTGVGKTELAKSLAHWLFGSDEACIRFDMSEYQLKQSDQRLLGAPPGYVGYDEGGQLTNAVKEHPFSVLLFDEIEKANVSVLDKFLQILEDGRMTDGRGETVYFNDCLIIFTSNLGVYEKDDKTGKTLLKVKMPTTEEERDAFSYDTYRQNIMQVIKSFFINEIGRPELLNRIGDNFLIFNYISPQAAEEILNTQLKKIQEVLLRDRKILLGVDKNVKNKLLAYINEHLEDGGRGVGNAIEKHILNPLAREIASALLLGHLNVKTILIKDIDIHEDETKLKLEIK